jgi:hypothetical protein
MALDTEKNTHSVAGDSELDNYGVWVKNPPLAPELRTKAPPRKTAAAEDKVYGVQVKNPPITAQAPRLQEEAEETSIDSFLNAVSSDSSFEDVFESIENKNGDSESPSGIAHNAIEKEIPQEFLTSKSCDNVKFTVSDSEIAAISKEVPIAAQNGHDVPVETPVQSEPLEAKLDSASSAALDRIAGELSALKNEIALLKTDFESLKNQGLIYPPQGEETDFEETAEAAEDFSAETAADESHAGFFSSGSDDETIALSGDELQNILTNSEFPESGSTPDLGGIVDLQSEQLPSIDAEAEDDIFIEKDLSSQNEAEEIETASGGSDIQSDETFDDIEMTDDAEAFDDIEIPADTETTDDADFVNTQASSDFLISDDIEDIEDIEIIDESEAADIEIVDVVESETADINFESEELKEPELGDIEFDEIDDFEETELPEEIHIPKAEENDFLVEEDFEIKNVADAGEIFEEENDSLDDDISEMQEIELAKESAGTEEIETAPETKTSECGEEELDDTPTNRVFGKQWGDAAATEEDDENNLSEAEAPVEPQKSAAQALAKDQNAANIDGGLTEQIKTVLAYMDELLEDLPEKKIEEFAHSEHFEIYKKLFDELGIS